MARSVRTTISIPGELKARMDATEEPVNWSAVAARAFEQELAKHIQKRGARDMQDVINRLRASKEKAGGEQYAKGREAGEEWARSTAEADQLQRLDAFRDSCGDGGYSFADYFEMETNAPLDQAGWIADAILGEEDEHDTNDARSYAEELFGEPRTSDYVRGFVDGALDVWSAVQDQL